MKFCKACSQTLPLQSFLKHRIINGVRTPNHSGICNVCVVARTRAARAANKRTYPSTVSLTTCFSAIIRKARKRRPCTITVSDLLTLWHAQSGLCALTGWPMTTTHNAGRVATNVSLDRKNSDDDYHLFNLQLVCAAVNSSKSSSSLSDFLAMCRAVTAHNTQEPTP
ncbi:hypothetical protein UFOVP235_54 [uncultured Caudovirales phage]|uniref:Uncharacterized protein n=1 Tax=uncultured Caudovirales phage TaxID=2100421 RepID=A0A6J7WQV1_9CAUD|nr:hypothetical protein UFOVP235_54 [uncultured Caudovirales phage]